MSTTTARSAITTCPDCDAEIIWLPCEDRKRRPFDTQPYAPDRDVVWGWSRRWRAMRHGAPVRGLVVHGCEGSRERWERQRLDALRITGLDEIMRRRGFAARGTAR